MPPKNSNAAVERPFNLTENEINFTVHACKLLVQDGKVRSKVPYNMTYIYTRDMLTFSCWGRSTDLLSLRQLARATPRLPNACGKYLP